MTDLLPCPFCGGELEANYYIKPHKNIYLYSYLCFNSDCPDRTFYKTDEEAIKASNARLAIWYPIKTAPKDGTMILLLYPDNSGVVAARYGKAIDGSGDYWFFADFSDELGCDCEWWMPLQEFPDKKEACNECGQTIKKAQGDGNGG